MYCRAHSNEIRRQPSGGGCDGGQIELIWTKSNPKLNFCQNLNFNFSRHAVIYLSNSYWVNFTCDFDQLPIACGQRDYNQNSQRDLFYKIQPKFSHFAPTLMCLRYLITSVTQHCFYTLDTDTFSVLSTVLQYHLFYEIAVHTNFPQDSGHR